MSKSLTQCFPERRRGELTGRLRKNYATSIRGGGYLHIYTLHFEVKSMMVLCTYM